MFEPIESKQNNKSEGALQLAQINNIQAFGKNPHQKEQMKKENAEINEELNCNRENMSDYQLFLIKSEIEKKASYPDVFSELSIKRDGGEVDVSDGKIFQKIFPLEHKVSNLINYASQTIIGSPYTDKKFEQAKINFIINEICKNYNIVPYHNFSHGFNLMKILYKCFDLDQNFRKLYNSEEITFSFLAALAHDINHPGTNNAYEVKMKTPLAQQSNNEGVLQKMHLHTFLNILKTNPEADLLSQSSEPEKNRRLIAQVIMATDMGHHFNSLKKLSKKVQKKSLNFEEEKDRYFVLGEVFHASDIGHPCLAFEEYLSWSILLTYQFNQQAKLEEFHGLQPTRGLQYVGREDFYEGCPKFAQAVVFPLWKTLTDIFPSFEQFLLQMKENMHQMQQKKHAKFQHQTFKKNALSI